MKYFLIIIITISNLYSVMAYPGKQIFTQNGGETFDGYVKGDEYLHYVQTSQGDILLFNKNLNSYTYAIIKDNSLVASENIFLNKIQNKKLSPALKNNFKNDLQKLYRYKRKNRILGN